jgi:HEAT repeat protein
MIKLVYAALNVRPEEQSKVLMLLGYGFLMGVFLATFQLSAETLLITRLGEAYISRGIFAAGVMGVISTAMYAFLQHRLPYGLFSLLNHVAIFLITSGFYLLFKFLPEENMPLLAFAQFTMLGPMVAIFLLGFWGIFGRMFDLRQSKRIIGGIDTGQLTAAIITFFTIGVGIKQLPQTYDLLIISSAAVAGTMIFLTLIIKKYKLGEVAAGYEEQENVPLKDMISNKYVVLLASFIAFSVFAYLLVENSYLSVLSDQYPASEEASLTTFLGWFNGSILVFSFVFQTFFNDRIIAQYGLRVSLTILPVILGVLTLVVLLVGNILGYTNASPYFFWFFLFVALSKLFVSFLRDALENPAFKLYFMTLKNSMRFDVQTKVEGVVVEFAKTLTGGVLLLLASLTFFELIHYSYIVLAVIAVWIYITGKLYAEYRNRIRIKLESQDISMAEMDVVQEAVVNMVRNNLENQRPSTSVFSFKLLEKINPNFVGPSINTLMRHNNSLVRNFAQEKMNSIRGVSVSDKYIIHANSKSFENGRKKVGEVDLKILFRTGEVSKRRIANLCRSEDAQDRQYGAELIGNMGSKDSLTYLIELLHDTNVRVRMAAIKSAEKRHNNEVLVALIENLKSSSFSNLAKSALVLIGNDALHALDNSFYKSGQDAQVMHKIVQIMGRIGGEEAISMLWSKIDFPDKIISSQVLQALSESGFKADLSQMTRIKYAIESDMADIAWNLAAYLEIPDNRFVKQLRDATREENEHDIKHIYTLLSMLYDPKSIQLVKQNLESKTNEGVTYAIELLDVLLSEDLKQKIIPILDDVSVLEKVKRLETFYPRTRLDSTLVLKFLINRDFTQSNRWTKACTINQIGRLKFKDFKFDLIANLFNRDKMIKEIAAWALYQLGEDLYHENIERLSAADQKSLNEIVLADDSGNHGDQLTFQKVRFLKSMDIFSEVSGLVLSYVADDMVSQSIEEGDTLAIDNSGTASFIIIRRGQLNFYRRGDLQKTMEPGEFIGETLESEDGGANMLVALEDSELLLINKDRYYELLSDNVLFAQSVMRYMSAS